MTHLPIEQNIAFTPVVEDTAGNGFTMVTQLCTYSITPNVDPTQMRIARFSIIVNWSGKGSAVAANGVRIRLPIAASATSIPVTCTYGYVSGYATMTPTTVASVEASNAYASLLTDQSATAVLVSDLSTSGEIYIAGAYLV